MNKKKALLIEKAHELFIKKGYHATSIQNILDHSGVSKGSFYNYFSSKAELFKEVLNSIQQQIEKERNALLIGERPADIDIFIKQVYVTLTINRQNRLFQLIEDAIVSNEPDLIALVKQAKFFFLKWVYQRFLEIFPKANRPYLFDSAVIFTGTLYYYLEVKRSMNLRFSIQSLITYTMNQTKMIVDQSKREELKLIPPERVKKWIFPDHSQDLFENDLSVAIVHLKGRIKKMLAVDNEKRLESLKLLHFIQDEIVRKDPRFFLIKSSLLSLEQCELITETKEFKKFKELLSTML